MRLDSLSQLLAVVVPGTHQSIDGNSGSSLAVIVLILGVLSVLLFRSRPGHRKILEEGAKPLGGGSMWIPGGVYRIVRPSSATEGGMSILVNNRERICVELNPEEVREWLRQSASTPSDAGDKA